MLNESLTLLSLDNLKDILLTELSIFNAALVYVLVYVIYKALGRYIYFKPQEHALKINRTFLALSLLVVLIHFFNGITVSLPFLPEYRWLFVMSSLVLFLAVLSISIHRIFWSYDEFGGKNKREWHYYHLPIPNEYYKTSVSKTERYGSTTHSWEEEGVESTNRNIHSDALLSVLSLTVFLFVCAQWAHESATNYGWASYGFAGLVSLAVTGIFIDQSVFSWIGYLEQKVRSLFKR